MLRVIEVLCQGIKDYFINFFPKGIPKKKLFPLLLMLLIEGISQNILNAYVGYLIVDMGTVSSLNEVGNYSGWLISSFSIAQFTSSFIIGALSDNLGRRPMLMVGTFGIAISNILFGFSFNYYFVVAMRLLNGMLNGTVGIVKAYMGEITDDSNRVQAFSFNGLTWSIGSVIGSFLGGVLYDPVNKYPAIFGKITIFKRFPALLPQLSVASFGFIALILAYFYLLENNVIKHEQKQEHQNKCLSILNSLKNTFKRMFKFFNKKNFWSIYCSILYSIHGFGNTTFMTIYPLLMIASVGNGGFGLKTNEVGYFAAVASLGSLTTLLFFYKPLVRIFGLRLTYVMTIICTSMFYGIFPSLEGFNGSSLTIKWVVYSAFSFCWNLVTQNGFSSISTLLVNAADVEYMGSANGIAQTFVSATRVLGPIIISPLLSWGLSNEFSYPLNQYLPFYILMIVGVINSIMMLFTPSSIDFVKTQNESNNQQEITYTELDEEKSESENRQSLDIITPITQINIIHSQNESITPQLEPHTDAVI
ncbi:transporter, major facilitator family protein [Entamoeba histolytica HM-1:IMSS-B]|uniref:Transporter, major facilitator family n=4 Tax=Entamoeba histolytica TaxID=5759 RepID=C4MB75_ENTH1|nr:transporter, major facilitator family [Entamoeba histolytica HM-1:IMSS]EAL45376.1 transporter, major facilitator family [Entamoeba histolytica HM-1:IMSS]EMH75054.1 transporter, major facilitator family protein [Entamoeba histolytica HM-1:IMSS-B]ENY63119.1 transporter, major facilitator family protein, putative [Entamoeba histolytica HM-1:IMSS-A]GAT99178.1 transporter major facilitator family [Entamoeba histolytica]|eukprot:XP_650762.1 transporter, major facilitator family [Entamoeba histolytica HM-1:IMSS]